MMPTCKRWRTSTGNVESFSKGYVHHTYPLENDARPTLKMESHGFELLKIVARLTPLLLGVIFLTEFPNKLH